MTRVILSIALLFGCGRASGPAGEGPDAEAPTGTSPIAQSDAGAPTPMPPTGALRIYWIDVEGGTATLLVAPSGQTLLNDAGWVDGGRDPKRIAAVLDSEVGRRQLDYFITSHYHPDHVGGVPELARLVTIAQVLDHGDTVEPGEVYNGYVTALAASRRMTVEPGMRLSVGGLELIFVASHGKLIEPPPTAAPNPFCAGAPLKMDVPDEDPQSVGFLLRYGIFDFLDLGDLTWALEHDLACPVNRIGEIDLFQVSQHGSAESNPPELVHALAPKVAALNCGPYKGNAPRTFETLKMAPGIEAIWQVHRTISNDLQHNAEDAFIANPSTTDEAHWLKATVESDGRFSLTNGRTMQSVSYQAR